MSRIVDKFVSEKLDNNMTEVLKECPVCQQAILQPFLTCTDFTVSREQFSLVKCATCSFVFTNPRPTMDDSGRYYKSEEYISHTNSSKGILNKIYQFVRNNAIKSKLNLVESYSPRPKSILDYGCGTGEFLSAAKKGGWSSAGLELDEDARALAKNNHQLNVDHPKALPGLPAGQFGVITLWHVLEHVHTLHETVKQLKRCLSSEGVLIIAVPNYESYDATVFGEYWAAYDVPRHIYHFNKASMATLMEGHGMKLVETKGMFFDPFYISLLSSKYKNGYVNPIKAFFVGLKTNYLGKQNIQKNSSIIYVFKKVD